MYRRPSIALILSFVLTSLPALAQDAVGVVRDGFTLGGMSGIEVSDDGASFLAVSDRGLLVEGVLERKNGVLRQGRLTASGPFRAPNGQLVRPADIDSEGLAYRPHGPGFVMSLEGDRGFWRYANIGATPTQIPPPPDPNKLHPNAQYEAVAIAPNGNIITLPERSGHKARAYPIWSYDGKKWRLIRHLARRDDYMPVGADFGPDGSFYLLERAFKMSFFARIRRIDLDKKPDEGIVVWSSVDGSALNYEGLSAWTDPQGVTHLTLISDNNFLPMISTTILEISLATKAATH